MLVDVHAHFGHVTPQIPSPAAIAGYARTCGLDAVLVSNRDAAAEPHEAANLDEADANVACLDACREHPRLAAVYWVRPGQVDSNMQALLGALRTAPFVAASFSPAENRFDAGDRLLDPYLAALAKAHRPALFCVSADERAGPAKVYEQARRQPDVPVVLCVCGDDASVRAAALDVVGHARRRGDADLYLDTSHANADDIRTALRVVGTNRLVFGSNALHAGAQHATQVAAVLSALRNELSPVDFHAVMGETAANLFGLTRPTA